MTIPDITTPTRKCTKCRETYPATIEYFNRSKAGKYGLNSVCITCVRLRAATWRDENREKIREYDNQKQKEYYQRDPEKFKERKRRYRRDKAKHQSEVSRIYRLNNLEKFKRLGKLSRIRRHAIILASNQRRRAREYGAIGSFTAQDIERQVKCQTDKRGRLRCWWCSKVITHFVRDHRIPLAKGGSNYPENICLCCVSCNSKKRDKMPWEWIGRLL